MQMHSRIQIRIRENESIACESPGAFRNTGLSVEQHLLRERFVRRTDGHDGAGFVSDDQQVSEEQKPAGISEADTKVNWYH